MKWQIPERKEHYSVIARTIEGKEAFREKGYFAFDLENFQSRVMNAPGYRPRTTL